MNLDKLHELFKQCDLFLPAWSNGYKKGKLTREELLLIFKDRADNKYEFNSKSSAREMLAFYDALAAVKAEIEYDQLQNKC